MSSQVNARYCFVIIWFWTKSWSGPSWGFAAFSPSWAPDAASGDPPQTRSPTWPGTLTSWHPQVTSWHPRDQAASERIPPQSRCHESCHKCVTCQLSQSRSSSPVRKPGSWWVLLLLHHPDPLVLLHPRSTGKIFILASIVLLLIAYNFWNYKRWNSFSCSCSLFCPFYHITLTQTLDTHLI